MHAYLCVCARARACVRDGVRGGQSPANYDSAAERLAAENLQLLSEKHRLAAENAVLQKTVARLRVRLDEAGVLDSDDASSTGERERERGRLLGGKSELSLDPSAWVDWGDGEEGGEGESEIDPSEAGGWGEAELSEGSFFLSPLKSLYFRSTFPTISLPCRNLWSYSLVDGKVHRCCFC